MIHIKKDIICVAKLGFLTTAVHPACTLSLVVLVLTVLSTPYGREWGVVSLRATNPGSFLLHAAPQPTERGFS